MFQQPDYKPFVSPFKMSWSVPVQASEDEKIKIWNEAINQAMLALYEAGFHSEVVAPVKSLLK